MLNKVAFLTLLAAATTSVLAAPTPIETEVLRFALVLEHLENAFYIGGLERFSLADFENIGLPGWIRGRFEQISEHEATHVAFLKDVLGNQAIGPCQYDFGKAYEDTRAFAAMSMIFETVGASAYLGAAKFLENKDYLTAAASILAVESRQASWVTSSVMQLQPWNGPFDIPLSLSGAYSLAAPFIKNCPSSYAVLNLKTFPALKLSNDYPSRGEHISVDYSQRASGKRYLAWLHGLGVEYTEIATDGQTSVPRDLKGIVYVVVVSTKETPNDDNMLSGFAIAQFPFGSADKDSAKMD